MDELQITKNLNLKIADIISLFALIMSIFSFVLSKKALDIAKRQEEKKEPKITTYLENSFYKILEDDLIFVFEIILNNNSDSDNSITECELKITFKREDESEGNLSIRCDNSLAKLINYKDGNHYAPPFQLKPYESRSGKAFFKLNKKFANTSIEKYEVIFSDIHGRRTSTVVSLMKGE